MAGTLDEAEVPLTVTEFSILRTLAVMPGKVFSRDAIIDRLHGPGFAITTGRWTAISATCAPSSRRPAAST